MPNDPTVGPASDGHSNAGSNQVSSAASSEEKSATQIAWGVSSHGESRWPASLAIIAAISVYVFLPERYTLSPSWLIPALELAILIPVSLSSPRRVANESRLMQLLAVAMIGVVTVANLSALVLLIRRLLELGHQVSGTELLFSSVSLWITNVIVFSLWYWEIDRGGPDDRAEANHRRPDFLFPQMSTPGCGKPDWTPRYADYLFLAFTNSTAFSPTDVMPLTPLAKMLMMTQAIVALVTISLIAARAVNILS